MAAVTDKDLGYRDFVRDWKKIGNPELVVGIRGDKVDEEGFPLAAIGAANEFGVRNADGTIRIPERSFLRSTVSENQETYFKMLAKGVGEVVDGTSTIERALGLVGLKAVGDVQQKITDIREPPNAPSTIAAKGSDNPLIDTGRMRQSIDFQVRKGSGGS